MPQPVTHCLVCREALCASLSDNFWASYANFAGFGSFGPDLFYIHEFGSSTAYTEAADIIHADGTYDCYCAMLSFINRLPESTRRDKLKAYAYGFYSHVVTDSIFHPFVYRQTKDHWKSHPADTYKKHKALESVIDNYLIAKWKADHPDQEFDLTVKCNAPNSTLLDEDVFSLLVRGLAAAYGNTYANNDVFKDLDVNQEIHPVQKAYRDYYDLLGADYLAIVFTDHNLMNREKIIPFNDWQPAELSPLNEKNLGKKWFDASDAGNHGLIYSVSQLFDKAVKAVSKVVQASEAYFQDPQVSSRYFFHEPPVLYLKDNNNLDTGLISLFNNDLRNTSPDDTERFTFGADIVAGNLASL